MAITEEQGLRCAITTALDMARARGPTAANVMMDGVELIAQIEVAPLGLLG